jgi:hypothetical protein
MTLRIMEFMDFVQCSEFEITRKHNISETESLSSSGEGKGIPTVLDPLERKTFSITSCYER